jgi:mRNA interferase MazF
MLDFGEPLGHEQGWQRPALIVSSDEWNRHATVLTVLPLTRTKHDLPTRVEIEPDRRNGLNQTSYARCEDIRSVSDVRLVRRIGSVDLAVVRAAARVIRTFLEL